MKNLKKITATLVFTFLLIGISTASAEVKESEEKNQKILTMRVFEAVNGPNNSIAIVYEDGKIEEIELDRIGKKGISVNLVTINNTLNSITKKGYELISTSGGGDYTFVITTYTFIKK